MLLTSDTENAKILYTLDGSDPTISEAAITYSEDKPIIINDDAVTIKAMAQGHDMVASDVAQFDYTLKKSTIAYQLHAGWSWISHNLENPVALNELTADIERLTSQTQEVIKDPVVGLIGNLKSLYPGEAYMVKVAADAASRLQGYECNAAVTAVPRSKPGSNGLHRFPDAHRSRRIFVRGRTRLPLLQFRQYRQ